MLTRIHISHNPSRSSSYKNIKYSIFYQLCCCTTIHIPTTVVVIASKLTVVSWWLLNDDEEVQVSNAQLSTHNSLDCHTFTSINRRYCLDSTSSNISNSPHAELLILVSLKSIHNDDRIHYSGGDLHDYNYSDPPSRVKSNLCHV